MSYDDYNDYEGDPNDGDEKRGKWAMLKCMYGYGIKQWSWCEYYADADEDKLTLTHWKRFDFGIACINFP